MGIQQYCAGSTSDYENIREFVNCLSSAVEDAASKLYFIENFDKTTNIKLKQWYKAASELYVRGTTDRPIEAVYGYAVEEYVNVSIQSSLNPPRGYSVKLQVTHGHTRPDIVIQESSGSEVAWLDITNHGNLGHINYKQGNWLNKNFYVAELFYPDFDPCNISIGGDGIGYRGHMNSIVRVADEHNKQHLRYMVKRIDCVLSNLDIRLKNGENIDLSDIANRFEHHFGIPFSRNYKHPIIHSMFLLYMKHTYGLHKELANEILRVYYAGKGQNKLEALSYVAESYNLNGGRDSLFIYF